MDSKELRNAYNKYDDMTLDELLDEGCNYGGKRSGGVVEAGTVIALSEGDYIVPFKKRKRTPGEMVREFHHAFHVPVAEVPANLDEARKRLRLDLIDEEHGEVHEAAEGDDPIALIHELGDLVYVAYGAALELGADLDVVIAEIHRANMSKLGPDGKPILREDGKVLKGEGFTKADVAKALGL